MAGPTTTTAGTPAAMGSKAAFLHAFPGYGYGPARGSGRRRPRPPETDGPGEYDDDEGHALEIDRLRAAEFPALYHPRRNPQGVVYLDHAGATLHARSQLARCHERLQEGVFGNPHSKGPVASATTEQVEEARALVLEHFNGSPEEWSVVFTAGATAALKLAAESFPWRTGGRLVYAHNSHTSVLGMREVARGLGAGFACLAPGVQYAEAEALARGVEAAVAVEGGAGAEEEEEEEEEEAAPPRHHLLVLPGECNFSGRKLDLEGLGRALALLEEKGQVGGGRRVVSVLLDAAKLVGTAPLDLCRLPRGVEMLSLSFYKMFGYPTGLGCLLLRHTAPWVRAHAQHGDRRRGYFGGGTVLAALPARDFVRLRPEPAHQLADGTQAYLGIIAAAEGLRTLRSLGGERGSGSEVAMAAVAAHTGALAAFLHDALAGLRHGNGAPVVELYSARPQQQSQEQQGPIVAFNLRRASGETVGYTEVEKLCALHGLQLRTGCFCNPGGCQEALGLSEQDVLHQLAAGHVCWDENDLVDGRPTGAVRASFGYMSTWEDACALLRLVDKYFVSKTTETAAAVPPSLPAALPADALTLGAILLYPIKSCGAMRVEAWPLGPTGLLFDREWALVDAQGQALRLNRLPQMRFVQPHVDLEAQVLRVTAPGMAELCVPLTLPGVGEPSVLRDVSVCGEACQGVGYEGALQERVDAWFSAYLGKPCTLVRAAPHAAQRRAAHQRRQRRWGEERQEQGPEEPGQEEDGGKKKKEIGFSNEAQFLLVSQASVDHLNGLIAQQEQQRGEEGAYEFRYEGRRGTETVSYVTIENFRPNLVVDGGVAHQEDLWASLQLLPAHAEEPAGGVRLQVTGACARCSMVNIDPAKREQGDGRGEKGAVDGGGGGVGGGGDAIVAPVLKTLASYRRDKANIYFGQFLVFADEEGAGGGGVSWLRAGMRVRARRRSDEAATK